MIGRRKLLAATAIATLAAPSLGRAQGAARVVVIGGGFAGTTAARTLKKLNPALTVTLVEPNETFTACPFSNGVLGGLRTIQQQQFKYDNVTRSGVTLARTMANAVDASAKSVTLADGNKLSYDRLVMTPGIDIRWDGLSGYTEDAAERMPHAWRAGAQTLLLRRQLEAMQDGGVVVMSAPANPFRCPPGPYERASLIAHYLKTRKPRSKLIILDAKDVFSKQRLFTDAWKKLYPDTIEWVGLSKGGKVTAVDPTTLTLTTDFGQHKAAVANVIPPQKAGAIAAQAGVANNTGWCPVDPMTFESTLVPNIHVVGDAAIMGAMPKSAFAANSQAKALAEIIVDKLAGRTPAEPRLMNTCYSVISPDYGITVAGVYRPDKGQLADIPGAGGNSPIDADDGFRGLEAQFAEGWFKTITAEVFG